MTEFKPPILTRETEDLIAIANSSPGNWQQLAIDQAKAELKKRGVDQDHQQKVLNIWKEEERQIEIEYQQQRELNQTEGYTPGKMFHIFFTAPFILIGKWTVDLSLLQLKKDNYQKKFYQRLWLLIGGTVFWFSLILLNVYISKAN